MARQIPADDLTDLTLAHGVASELELDVRIVADAVVGKTRHVAAGGRSLREIVFDVDLDGARVDHVVEGIGGLRRNEGLIRLDDDVFGEGLRGAEVSARFVEAIGRTGLLVGFKSLTQGVGQVDEVAEKKAGIQHDFLAAGVRSDDRSQRDDRSGKGLRDSACRRALRRSDEKRIRPGDGNLVAVSAEANDARARKLDVRKTRGHPVAAEAARRNGRLDEIRIELRFAQLQVEFSLFTPQREEAAFGREPLGEGGVVGGSAGRHARCRWGRRGPDAQRQAQSRQRQDERQTASRHKTSPTPGSGRLAAERSRPARGYALRRAVRLLRSGPLQSTISIAVSRSRTT